MSANHCHKKTHPPVLTAILAASISLLIAGCGGGGGGSSSSPTVYGSATGYVYAEIGSNTSAGRQAAAPTGSKPLQGATVTVQTVGSTTTASNGSYTIKDIPPGVVYTIVISKSGYTTLSFQKQIAAGANVITPENSSSSIMTLKEAGSLSVQSDPPGASILIDGQNSGLTTPYTFDDLAVGDHTVELSLSGYTAPAAKLFTVGQDQEVAVDLDLIPSASSNGSVSGALSFPSSSSSRTVSFAEGRQPAGRAKYDPNYERAKERRASRRVASAPCANSEFREGELMVKVASGTDRQTAAGMLGELGLTLIDWDPDGLALAKLAGEHPGLDATRNKCFDLLGHPAIESVRLNGILHASRAPNDTNYASQWHLGAIKAPDAWGITTGKSNIIVAVIDTGIISHPDLAANMIDGYDFISDVATANDGDGRDADPTDDGYIKGNINSSWHGTNVAGVIAAVTDNSRGIAGVGWNVKFMPLRYLGLGAANDSAGSDFDLIAAVKYAARLSNASGKLPANRANVINMSLGGRLDPHACQIQDAITSAREAGVTIFAAAGNSGDSPNHLIDEPAICDGVIAVGATDQTGNRASFSSYKPSGDAMVDLVAPGTYIVTTNPTSDGSESYSPAVSGTSFSTPVAAGVAALVLSLDPTLTPDEVQTVLTDTATDVTSSGVGTDEETGAGIVNAYAALQQVQQDQSPVLALSAASVDFEFDMVAIKAIAGNSGGGTLVVSSVSAAESGGSNWLSATASTDPDDGTIGIKIAVDRSNLLAGSYSGTITVNSTGGNGQISVKAAKVGSLLISVRQENSGLLGSFNVVGQATTSAENGFLYQISGLPPASNYQVWAGTDLDGDDTVCDSGETWCGAYTSRLAPSNVSVTAGQDKGGIDFQLDDVSQ